MDLKRLNPTQSTWFSIKTNKPLRRLAQVWNRKSGMKKKRNAFKEKNQYKWNADKENQVEHEHATEKI
jgi:hypothetical protein